MNSELRETVETTRRWIAGTTVTKISLSSVSKNADLSEGQITAFATSLLEVLSSTLPILSRRVGDIQELANLRGRPAETFSSDSTALRQRQEELCFIKGSVAPRQEDEELAADEMPEAQPFSIALNTKFEKIVSREISHRAVFSTTGAITSWGDYVALNTLCKLPLLEITSFRLGFEHFVASFFGSMLGSIPTIRSRFYLSLSKDSFKLTIEADNKALSVFMAEILYSAVKQASRTSGFQISPNR